MKTKTLVSLFILCCIGACRSSVSPDEPDYKNFIFHITGTVTDSINGSPVIARVDLCVGFGGWVTGVETNGQGQYILNCSTYQRPDTKASSFYLVISAEGYITKSISSSAEIHVRITEELQIIDVKLDPIAGGAQAQETEPR